MPGIELGKIDRKSSIAVPRDGNRTSVKATRKPMRAVSKAAAMASDKLVRIALIASEPGAKTVCILRRLKLSRSSPPDMVSMNALAVTEAKGKATAMMATNAKTPTVNNRNSTEVLGSAVAKPLASTCVW